MKADIELVITHDGEQWVAANETIAATGRTLEDLDADVDRSLRENGAYSGSPITVFMGYDFDSFPTWMRQHASHYFNRYVRFDDRASHVELRSAASGESKGN